MPGTGTETGAGRVVVAGASMAGLRAAEQLRAAGWTGAVTVVGDEPHMPYNRPPLSKEVLAGKAPFESLAFRPRASVADVQWRLGTKVVAARLAERTVELDDGSTLSYDGLVVATGMRPRRLGCSGPLMRPPHGPYAGRRPGSAGRADPARCPGGRDRRRVHRLRGRRHCRGPRCRRGDRGRSAAAAHGRPAR